MVRPLACLLSVAALTAPALRAADDDPKAVLARAVQAHGGEEFLVQHPAARSKNKGTITLPGVGEAEFTQDVSYMLPGKFKEAMELTVAGQKVSVRTVVNGNQVSIEANGQPVPVSDAIKAAMSDVRHVMAVSRLVAPLRDKGYELAPFGAAKVGDKPAVGVRVSLAGRKDVTLFFDRGTGLLAKLEHRTTDAATGTEVTEERIVAEYRTGEGGVPVPKKVAIKRDGKAFLEAVVVEVKMLEKIDDAEFKK